ncbi:hypothetical protein SAMN04489806_0062 [Paramicrobacterium humi]|uniref:Uncharacterized protein n=1 Tax=Paramicrobacterium humi TaxID=640635 RepID=A0A1H4IMT5_9MICO|nr:hypothetical protein SAMN04489806_0062 [Microbacterium humi]
MRHVVVVELERVTERIENSGGGVPVLTPFKPKIIVGADPGKHGKFLAAQSWHTPYTVDAYTRLLRCQQAATRLQVCTKRIRAFSLDLRHKHAGVVQRGCLQDPG